MPRNSGVDILNIRPDAAMGAAQDSNIPVIATELEQVNKATEAMRNLDHQKQLQKYDNDLKQQNNLLKGLAEDAVSADGILPEDMEAFKQSEAEDRKSFLNVKSTAPDKNGQNQQYDEYVRTHQKHKDFSVNAQAKYVAIQKLRDQLATETLPEEKAKLQAHIDKEIKRPVGDPIRPYQKAFTFDIDKMVTNAHKNVLKGGAPTATTTKTTTGPKGTTVVQTTAPSKGGKKGVLLSDGQGEYLNTEEVDPDKKVDFQTILFNTTDEFKNNQYGRTNQVEILNSFQESNAPEAKAALEAYNKSIREKHNRAGDIPTIKIPSKFAGPPDPNNPNSEVGRSIDTGEYPDEINYHVVGDKVIVDESTPMFNAKIALAKWPGELVEKGEKRTNLEAWKANLDKWKAKQNAANDRSRIAIEWSKLNDAKQEDKDGASSVINEAIGIIKNGVPNPVYRNGKNVEELRVGDPALLQMFGNIDKDGKTTNVPDFLSYDKERNQIVLSYYKNNYNPQTGQQDPTNVIDREVPMDQRTWLKVIAKRSYPNKDIGKINQLVDGWLTDNGNDLYKISQKDNAGPEVKYKAKMADGSLITSPDGVKWFDKNGKEIKQ